MNEVLFQKIFDKLQDYVPTGWKRIAFYAMYSEGSYSMKYFVDFGNETYIDCFSVKNATNMQLMQLFMSMNKEISAERDKLKDLDKWNVLTMVIDSKGHFKTEFDYSDISEEFVSYEQKWKNNYLE